ncbi:MAG TPA: HAMP domain-containing sensor histidine kinase, partial [Chloroflexota bacterium]
RPSSSLVAAGFGLPAAVFYPLGPGVLHTELTQLPRRYDELAAGTVGEGARCSLATLPSGRGALVLALTLPGQEEVLATLAVALPSGRFTPAVDPDILASFADRSALAIENASLYRTLARRSDDLQRAYADLASAHQELLSVDEMKTNFLANVSHELRTPLTSIRSFAELLLTYDDPAVRQEFLQIIKLESERLTRLVNDVLDITKIESGFMEWRMAPVDLAVLLRESARLFESTMLERALTFEQEISPDLPTVHADPDRLQQVIANLLHNAMKFTTGGVISLRAWWTGEEVRIAVADTGRGVALEDQERIFEKFQQVGALLTDKPPGTGLGLAICRDIIMHHEGRLWMQSQPGQGSTFTIALPAAADGTGGDIAALVMVGGYDGGGTGR